MVKYDPRYANAVGKYLLHVARNAKVFFPTALPLSRQSMTEYLAYDLYGSIAYEGFKNEAGGIATGDATRLFSQPSDLSLYSSAFIGAFGGMIAETDISGVLKVDLNNTDSYGLNQYPHYLLYNPHMDSVIVRFRGPETAYDVFDKASNTILAKNVSGTINLKIEGNSSLVVVVLPANSSYQAVKNEIFVGDYKLSEYMASVNLPSLFSRQELTEASTIAISYDAAWRRSNINEIYFGISSPTMANRSEFNYDKSVLPDTDYEIRVEITTRTDSVIMLRKGGLPLMMTIFKNILFWHCFIVGLRLFRMQEETTTAKPHPRSPPIRYFKYDRYKKCHDGFPSSTDMLLTGPIISNLRERHSRRTVNYDR